MKSSARRGLVRLGVLGVLAFLIYWLHPLLLPPAARWLDVSEPPQRTDDVMVLGGESSLRPFVAAALYQHGYARHVLIPRVKPSLDAAAGLVPTEDEVIYQVLRKRGVPAEDIERLTGEVDSTADEAAALARYLADKPERTVTVVSTCYHTRRVRWMFRKQLGERAGQLHFFGGPTEGYDTSNWWRSEQGAKQYLNEYVKLPFYLINH